MINFSKRSSDAEIMDDLQYAGEMMDQTLIELEIINKWLGGNNVTIEGLTKLLRGVRHKGTIVIADLGCGRGDMLRLIDSWAKKRNHNVRLIGIDANPYIVQAAQKNLIEYPYIELQAVNVLSPDFRQQKFDIVIGTLFYHHFTNEQLTEFFTHLRDQARIGILINDIHRHSLAYHSIRLLTGLFSRSSMVKFDAPLSVLRAFSRKELSDILQAAGITDFTIRWKWAFRWQVLALPNGKTG